MYEETYRCQRCGAVSDDWLCWDHMEEYHALAEKEERERERENRYADARARFMDERLIEEERRLRDWM